MLSRSYQILRLTLFILVFLSTLSVSGASLDFRQGIGALGSCDLLAFVDLYPLQDVGHRAAASAVGDRDQMLQPRSRRAAVERFRSHRHALLQRLGSASHHECRRRV